MIIEIEINLRSEYWKHSLLETESYKKQSYRKVSIFSID